MAFVAVSMVSSDELLAQTLARREQEYEDAAFARRLAVSSAGVDQSFSRALDPAAFESPLHGSGMLYIACQIADSEVEILVDTGAEMSVISEQLAAQLGLLSNLDRSYQGTASGVGSAPILGRLWHIPAKLGLVEFALNFSVLRTPQPLLILGLDQMRLYKCHVDLERNCLTFGGTGGVAVHFLPAGRGMRPSPIDAVFTQSQRAATSLRQRDPAASRVALGTLKRLLSNIVANPGESKYRLLRSSSDRLQREVLAHPECVELLRLAGFVSDGEDLVLPASASLHAARQLVAATGPLQ